MVVLYLAGPFLAALLFSFPIYSQAASYLLVKSGNGQIYNRFEHRLKMSLRKINQDNIVTTSNVDTITAKTANPGIINYDAIISVGIEASIAVSNLHTKKLIVMSMIPRQSFTKLNASGAINCNPDHCRVIFLGQPVVRQLRLITFALPDKKQITVISSSYSSHLLDEINKTAIHFGLTINSIKASDESSVLTAMSQKLTHSDILMAIPDPVVFNRNTARAILLSAFHQHIPLFAYSRSFVRAGATLGIYSTPEDIARHVAELISIKPPIRHTQHTMYPKYYTIDINHRAADALDLNIPDARVLKKKMMAHEN